MSDGAPSGVLAKALGVLQSFTVEDTTLGFAELQRRTGFAKSTLHRVLADLVAARLLMPLHATAIGKVLLAHGPAEVRGATLRGPLERRAPRTITHADVLSRQLAEVVAQGVAYEYEESAVGIVCVAAGIFDPADGIVAAVSVTGPVHRFQPARHANSVRAAAAGISATLGRRAELRER
ncbi:IclR family transcriptional regulator [Streptomyces albidoflavus]|uniref:IclR family transcriptional regulator n=1 Tax=Streptomyces albidoflavus TaxID=1886 RepID=UPI00341BE3C8